ncbi:MAG TPA: hypothetical protein VHH72_07835 [Solirubrobacterales bacterium]|jgi:hypothetical protein|nr:hypothetical protein [Solirubrobacterales bacterium]
MRKALNENKKVQIGLIAGLGLVAAFMLMSMKGGGESAALPPESVPGGPAVSPASAGTTEVGVDVSVNGESAGSATASVPTSTGTVAPATTGAVAPATTVTPEALKPGPGLPAPVVRAWRGGDAIALLIVRGGATDDRLVRGSVESLSGRSGLSVFIARAKRVARYSRITQGVGVNRVPALVVIRPRRISGSVPQALVSYGFRNSQSVVQAVDDALYSGKDNVPYYPG